MPLFHRIVLLAAASLLVACGNLQVVKLAEFPAPLAGSTVQLITERPSKEQVAPRSYEVPGRSIFLRQSSGGSLAVGLLLGPLGVAANVANIDRLTNEMGASGAGSSLYAIDPLEEAQAAWNQAASTAPSPRSISVQPYMIMAVVDEKVGISTVVALRVEARAAAEGDGSKKWIGIYSYALKNKLPLRYLKEPLPAEPLREHREAIRVAFRDLYGEIRNDVDKPAPKRQIAWVKADVLGLGLPGDIETNAAGRLSLRVNGSNMGAMVTPLAAYSVTVFPTREQYTIDNGPVDRKDSK